MIVDCEHAISHGRCWRRPARPLGNWDTFTDQSKDQTREHDAANQTGEITGDLDWVDPEHDAAGNMILAPRPGDESCSCEALLLVYDGWNRLAKAYEDADGNGEIGEGDTLIAEYQYDGQGPRIARIARRVDGEDVTYERTVSKAAPSGECLRANRCSRFRCGAGGLLSHAFGVHR